MRFLAFLIFTILHTGEDTLGSIRTDSIPRYLDKTERYIFYSNFWFNMHHLLQNEALLQTVADSSGIADDITKQFSSSERATFNTTLEYYKSKMVKRDLRTDDYMWEYKQWIITQPQASLSDIPPQFQEHMKILEEFEPVYTRYFWDQHNSSNKTILQQNIDLIRTAEDTVANRLEILTRTSWDEEKIRVDICYYAKGTEWLLRDRPYTTTIPRTLVVMNSSHLADTPKGTWVELLFHESSHPLIRTRTGFVAGTILDVANSIDVRPLRQLWHAYLFYFSGVLSRRVIVEYGGNDDYQLYMVTNDVFSDYYPFLDKYLSQYMDGSMSLHDATKGVLLDFYESRK